MLPYGFFFHPDNLVDSLPAQKVQACTVTVVSHKYAPPRVLGPPPPPPPALCTKAKVAKGGGVFVGHYSICT